MLRGHTVAEVQFHSFLSSVLDRDEWPSSCLGCCSSWKEPVTGWLDNRIGLSIHLLFYRRLNISFPCRFRSPDIPARSITAAPITVSRDPLLIKTSFYMNDLRRYCNLFLFVSMDRGKFRKISRGVPPKIEPRLFPMQGTSDRHSTKFHTVVHEA